MKVDGAKAVLGIDAAWTLKEPSGVALVVEQRDRWRCVGLAPSCEQFERLGDGEPVDWGSKPQGGMLHIDKLLSAASKLLSDAQLCVITVDMPLSLEAIAGRREADRAVSPHLVRAGVRRILHRRRGRAMCHCNSLALAQRGVIRLRQPTLHRDTFRRFSKLTPIQPY